MPGTVVGAGTVITPDQAADAVAAGTRVPGAGRVGGSRMPPEEAVAARDRERVQEPAREAAALRSAQV